ncbi:MAG TPA: hypothetical protein VN442_17195 [Bryobacteraceae bacterium]|nr:hypothetical protein [Bryobacteraceae bacterium]HWR35825.1 hypothetical protein [Clostridia bacterium]
MPIKLHTVSIRKGAGEFELAETLRVSPEAKLCGAAGNLIRCLSVARGRSVLTDVDPASLTTERRINDLPVFHRMWFHPDGDCLAYTQKGKVGNPSTLFFVTAKGSLAAQATLPNAISEATAGPACWHIGCRNGRLYTYSLAGLCIWRRHVVRPRPNPYSLVAAFTGATEPPYLSVASSWPGPPVITESERIFLFSQFGHRRWRSTIPNPHIEQYDLCMPSYLPVPAQALQKLGIECRDRVPLGFVRLVFDSTVPTRSTSAPRSLFNKSIESFEEAAGETGEVVLARVDLMPGRSGSDEVIRSVATWYQRIAIGTTEGRVHVFDFERTLLMSFCVGRGPVSAIVADHRGLKATYCAGLLTTFEDNDINGCVKLPDYYANVAGHVAGVLVWRWNTVWFVNSRGRVIWKAEFSKVVRSVIPDDVGFTVLAGHLFSFRYLPSTERNSP